MTFTTEDRVTNYLATLEDANNTAENEYFFNIDNRVTYPLGGKAVQLNNAAPIGVAISFGVVPGDKIDLSTKAYYTNTSGFGTGATNSGTFANAVSSAFGGLNGGVEGNQQFIYDLFTALGTALLSPAGNVDNQPSAYLNYLVFDQNYVLNTGKSGYVGIGANASTEQTLSASNIEIDQAGFVYIYVSNESNSSNYVYFDNLDVTINESRILEKSDYYPFGLSFNNYSKAGMINQNFKYNGKELVADLDLGWYDYQARWYDPSLGRWHVVDPAADLMRRHSPYNYVFDNPIRFIDPDGMIPTNPLFMNGVGNGIISGLKSIGSFARDTYNTKGGNIKSAVTNAANFAVAAIHDGDGAGRTIVKKTKQAAAQSIAENGGVNGAVGALVGETAVGVVVGMIGDKGLSKIKGLSKGTKADAPGKLHQPGDLPDNASVVRGGQNKAANFEKGSGVTTDASGNLQGVSVNSQQGAAVGDLSKGIPHNKIGTTTVGDVRNAGGNVVPSPTKNNPTHATMSGVTGAQAEDLMNITVNPSK